VVVSVLIDVHDCISSGQGSTSTPTTAWVADKALPILMSETRWEQRNYRKDCKRNTMWSLGMTRYGRGKRKL
jgi:hypothetical protein